MSKTICQEVSSRCKDADIVDCTSSHKFYRLPHAVTQNAALTWCGVLTHSILDGLPCAGHASTWTEWTWRDVEVCRSQWLCWSLLHPQPLRYTQFSLLCWHLSPWGSHFQLRLFVLHCAQQWAAASLPRAAWVGRSPKGSSRSKLGQSEVMDFSYMQLWIMQCSKSESRCRASLSRVLWTLSLGTCWVSCFWCFWTSGSMTSFRCDWAWALLCLARWMPATLLQNDQTQQWEMFLKRSFFFKWNLEVCFL